MPAAMATTKPEEIGVGGEGAGLEEVGRQEAQEGPHAHDPFAAQVEDARALVEILAQGRQEQRHRERHAQGQDVVDACRLGSCRAS